MSTALTKPQQATLQKNLEIIDNAKLDMVTGVVTIGAALIEIREIIETGFVEWVEEHCGFGKSSAYRYIDAAEQFGTFPKLGNFQDSALYVLARCDEAATKAKKLANKGHRITHMMAEKLVKEVKERGNQDDDSEHLLDAANGSGNEEAEHGADDQDDAIHDGSPGPLDGGGHIGVDADRVEGRQKEATAKASGPVEPNEIGGMIHCTTEEMGITIEGKPVFKVAAYLNGVESWIAETRERLGIK